MVSFASHAKSGNLSKQVCKVAIDAVAKGVLGGKVEESRS